MLIGGGMVGRKAELVEAVFVELHLGSVGDVESERHENLQDVVANAGDRVKPPRHLPAPGQSDVERGTRELRLACSSVEGEQRGVEGRLDLLLERVRCLAELAASIAGQLRHQLEKLRELALRSDVATVDQTELGFVLGCTQRVAVGVTNVGEPVLERLNRIWLCHRATRTS